MIRRFGEPPLPANASIGPKLVVRAVLSAIFGR